MKKMIWVCALSMVLMALGSTSAFAQDATPESEPYDFNRPMQFVGASAGAAAGLVVGYGVGFVVGGGLCEPDPGDDWSCFGVPVIGGFVGAAALSLPSAVLGTWLTGGEHTTANDIGFAFLGAGVGGTLFITTAWVLADLMNGANIDSNVALVTSTLLGAGMIGSGAALGYQLSYTLPIEDASFVPMLTPTHQGLSVVGRF